jgi:acetolactate synthase-1/3 small subunit
MKKEYITVAFVNNQISVLNRITSAYLKRQINIESLNVSESSIKGVSTVVISAFTVAETIERIVNQLYNMIDVHSVDYYLPEELIYKELALYKIDARIMNEDPIFDYVLNHSNGRIIEINTSYVVVEKSGTRPELERLKDKLQARNLLEAYSRSGNVVLHRGKTILNQIQKVS